MQRFSQFAFLILAVVVCFIAASDAVFRATRVWMWLGGRGFKDAGPGLPDYLIQLFAIAAFIAGVVALVIGLRRQARPIAWVALALMLVGPTLGILGLT